MFPLGTSVTKVYGFRIEAAAVLPRAPKFNGSSFSFSLEMVVLCSALSVLSSGAAAVMVIVSAVPPICNIDTGRLRRKNADPLLDESIESGRGDAQLVHTCRQLP